MRFLNYGAKSMRTYHHVITKFLFVILILASFPASAAEILLDQMVEAGGLKLFPVYKNPKNFYYLPDKIVIPNGKDGKPQFSFLKFARNVAQGGEGGVTKGTGGGLVSFLVSFKVDDATKRKAEQELGRKVSGARIIGPITYKSGTFAMISNFKQDNGDWGKRIVGLGKAPVMEGHKAAVSMRLTAEGATILWESFKQAASDISVSFEMEIAGLRDPYEATVKADWSKVAKNQTLAAGFKSTFMGFDIQKTMKELRDSNAISVEVKGKDEDMDKIWQMAYSKVADQIFQQDTDPALMSTLQDDENLYSNFDKAAQFNKDERDRVNQENQAERERVASESSQIAQRRAELAEHLPILDHLPLDGSGQQGGEGGGSGGAEGANGDNGGSGPQDGSGDGSHGVTPANIQNPPSFSLLAAYHEKQYKKTGKFVLSLKKWIADTQAMRFDENIGGFGKRMLKDPQHFRIINLDDAAYKQREVLVSLDGMDSADFGKFVNFVIVSLKKKHQDGEVTNQELKIDKNNFNKSLNNFRMLYGYKGDTDRNKWMNFEYKAVWSLYGGAKWDSGWKTSQNYVLPISAPHKYGEISVEADPQVFHDKKVRLATVTVYYKLFGKEHSEQVELKSTGNGTLSKVIKYAHAPNNYNYEYEIKWRLRGGKVVKSGRRKGNEQTLFADELPGG